MITLPLSSGEPLSGRELDNLYRNRGGYAVSFVAV
jgi:hypothetical protein